MTAERSFLELARSIEQLLDERAAAPQGAGNGVPTRRTAEPPDRTLGRLPPPQGRPRDVPLPHSAQMLGRPLPARPVPRSLPHQPPVETVGGTDLWQAGTERPKAASDEGSPVRDRVAEGAERRKLLGGSRFAGGLASAVVTAELLAPPVAVRPGGFRL